MPVFCRKITTSRVTGNWFPCSRSLERDYGFRPTVDIRTGLRKFAEWYKGYYIDRDNF